jgi:NADH dehydrogenase FAD-containing subunit
MAQQSNGPATVVITGGGFRGLSAAGSTPTHFNFNREVVRVEDEPAHPALQR